MPAARFSLLLCVLTAVSGGSASATEENVWPFWVKRDQPENTVQALGPLVFRASNPSARSADDPPIVEGLRPLFVRTTDQKGVTSDAYFAYPLFTYHRMTDGYRWSVFSLINHYETSDHQTKDGGFDLWPIYFSRETGREASSYHAVFPIYGSVRDRFFQDRFTWVLFPLYGRFEKGPKVTTAAPWPFIKVVKGGGHSGFDFWPLFGKREREGDYRDEFYLWPLIYKTEYGLGDPHPDVRSGFLPFYAQETSGELRSETYVWPFFGYIDRTAPYHYHEIDYFWPLLVQGRGDRQYVNRWAPFYTHSIDKGIDKTWVLWPVWRQQRTLDAGIVEDKEQLLYFLYYSTVQSKEGNPAAPRARKTHLWPLASIWKNGAGREQIQVLSPLEVFFPSNDIVRISYTPLFALYRYSQSSPDEVEHAFLWNLITYRRTAASQEFHFGPLFSRERRPGRERVAIGNGLFGFDRSNSDEPWHFFLLRFKATEPARSASASTP